MPDPWSKEPNKPTKPPKTEPWMAFGVLLILAVGAVLFAVATWIIQGHRADGIDLRLMEAESALTESKDEAEKQMAQIDQLVAEAATLQVSIDESRKELETAREQLRVANADVERLTRERDQLTNTVEQYKEDNSNPSALHPSSVASLVKTVDAFLAVASLQAEHAPNVSEGRLLEYLKQEARAKCGLNFNDTANTGLILQVVAVSAGDIVAYSAVLRVTQRWRVPGVAAHLPISVWHQHTVGLSSQDLVASHIEQTVGRLLDALADDIKAP